MPAARYFLAYRYTRRGHVHDGNTVLDLERPLTTEAQVREIETLLAESRGVDPADLGLTNIVALAYDAD